MRNTIDCFTKLGGGHQ